jgi:hypothetical protein
VVNPAPQTEFTSQSYLFFQFGVAAMDNHTYSNAHSSGEHGALGLTNSRAEMVKLH